MALLSTCNSKVFTLIKYNFRESLISIQLQEYLRGGVSLSLVLGATQDKCWVERIINQILLVVFQLTICFESMAICPYWRVKSVRKSYGPELLVILNLSSQIFLTTPVLLTAFLDWWQLRCKQLKKIGWFLVITTEHNRHIMWQNEKREKQNI